LWQLRCGHCQITEKTPEPTIQSPTPVPDYNNWWVHYLGSITIYDQSNQSYWYEQTINMPSEFLIADGLPKYSITERLYFGSNVAWEIARVSDLCYLAGINNHRWQYKYSVNPDSERYRIANTYKPQNVNLTVENSGSTGQECTAPSHVARGRREDGSYGPVVKFHFYKLYPYPPIANRYYEVKLNLDFEDPLYGEARAYCGEGDTPVGLYAGVAVQGGGIVQSQRASSEILDTGLGPLMLAQVDCGMECAASHYVASSYAVSLYPYAQQSSAVAQSPVLFRWSRPETLRNGVHNFSLVCYGTGEGRIESDSYCSIIDPVNEQPIDFSPYYRDDNCSQVGPVTVGDFTLPGVNICARVLHFGSLQIFGLALDLDLIARFMAAIAALFLIVR
jgi:hypothetical protein